MSELDASYLGHRAIPFPLFCHLKYASGAVADVCCLLETVLRSSQVFRIN